VGDCTNLLNKAFERGPLMAKATGHSAEAVPADSQGRPEGARTVVVIGGGVSGLATAALLARRGHSVTLVEKNPVLGGRAGSLESGGFRWDTGPSWYLMPEVFAQFYALLGMTPEHELDLARLDPAYAVWDGERGGTESIEVRSGRAHVRALFESLEPGSGATFDDYLDSAGHTYALALRRFLYNSFGARGLASAFARRDVLAVAPRLVPLLLRSLHSFVSGSFRNPTIRKILDYPAVFLGSSPYRTPALYHLMSHLDLDDGVYYPRGGFTTFVESLRRAAEREGVTILTDTEALEIKTRASRSVGVYSSRRPSKVSNWLRQNVPYLQTKGPMLAGAFTRATGYGPREYVATGVRIRRAGEPNPRVLHADAVIGAHDIQHLEERLLKEDRRTYPQSYWDKKIPGPGALVLMLGVRGELPQLRHHNLLFASDWKGGFEAIFGAAPHIPDPASLYICKPSATDSSVAPKGYENLFVLVPVPADVDDAGGHVQDPGALGYGDGDPEDRADPAQAAADRVIAQIAQWTGVPDLAERIVERHVRTPADFAEDVYAWRGTALGQAHTLAQSAMFRTKNSSRRVEGVYYAGSSTLPGIGVPMCLISAELAVHAVEGTRAEGPMKPRDRYGRR
jgi:phytoene dehydrogenase-like protein